MVCVGLYTTEASDCLHASISVEDDSWSQINMTVKDVQLMSRLKRIRKHTLHKFYGFNIKFYLVKAQFAMLSISMDSQNDINYNFFYC